MGTLKPCPFCGGTGDLFTRLSGHRGYGFDALVQCSSDDCAISVERSGSELERVRVTQSAIAAWNRRSDRAGLIAGLREALETADAHFAGFDTTGERLACRLIGYDIRSRIAALEEEDCANERP